MTVRKIPGFAPSPRGFFISGSTKERATHVLTDNFRAVLPPVDIRNGRRRRPLLKDGQPYNRMTNRVSPAARRRQPPC